ncbi:AAA family ATPase [Candidatus Micrarchaeota archaeon]|nr:AAA family ATPase [Candidatus Micrarchaeota archaeon]MBU1166619.1 AAA family ATPase [Candidatus Micrarchaeota archaeon]MBU1886654.1 AAA family ATPase [Candidatus Micrarchaeota archaeon]
MINDVIFSELFNESERLKKNVSSLTKKRFLFEELRKPRNMLIGFHGLRGTGKTTILLQLALEKKDSIYVNAEELAFRGISIIEFVEFTIKKDFKSLFIDEIHSIHSWSTELKLLYDRGYKNIYFSGSSGLKIQEKAADLSRRAILFYLPPFSFREFLDFRYNILLQKVSFDDIIDFDKRKELIKQLSPVINYFDEYLRFGTFPFYLEHKDDSYKLYQRILERIVRVDLAALQKIDVSYVETVYKIINILVISSPNEISYNSLTRDVNRNMRTIEEILTNLKNLGFLNAISPFKTGSTIIRKEYKFLISPPFRFTISKSLGFDFQKIKGGIREDIFISNTYMFNPKYIKTDRERKTPDYRINNLNFELGPHKHKHETDFYVKDELIFDKKVIPLALFCMLY